MKKILTGFIAIGLLTLIGCKKEEVGDASSSFEKTSKEKITGLWDKTDKYYLDNQDGMEQYYYNNIYKCGDDEISYTQRYVVKSIEWNFREDGTFRGLELGTIYSPTSLACNDGNNPDNYW